MPLRPIGIGGRPDAGCRLPDAAGQASRLSPASLLCPRKKRALFAVKRFGEGFIPEDVRDRRDACPTRQAGFAATELLVAIAILLVAVLPLAYSFTSDARLLRASYERAVAMQLVDGELEILAAGGWRAFTPGTHDFTLHGAAVSNLPPGRCQLTLTTNLIRLEWKSAKNRGVGAVVREVRR